mmetsp:Transcript_31995/g.67261  ORF Transcript_31995/g.67261 Transcript_31995/m.67261 type:complete len:472 (+) Transcript_31995:87-1502(+)
MVTRGRNSTWRIAKIFKDITWNAGIVARSAFRDLHKPRKTKPKKPTDYVRFVYKGQYYRRPIAKKTKSKPPKLLKLPLATVVPLPFKTPSNAAAQKAEALVASKPSAGSGSQQSTWSWRSWWKLNYPLLILNFGSMATLVGFTRADVIELRSLAIMGNTTFVIYSLLQPPPIRWATIGWQLLFASVNGFNVAKILNERKGKVFLSPHEEEIYHEHFERHGVTPKQYEKVMSTGKIRIIKKGGVLSRQGEQISSVKLVVRGDTRANAMGRHLTAMGSVKGNRYSMQGGDSGAWVGEMAFLQSLWDRDHAPKSLQKKLSILKSNSSSKVAETVPVATGSAEGTIIRSGLPPSDEPYKYCAISTIVAVDDIELIEWSFEDMEKVMKSSRYIQDSLTRAMTQAIVGKVVNFMVSRQSAIPKWSTLLDNWKHAGPRHNLQEVEMSESEEDEEEEVSRSLKNRALATSASWLLRHGL